MKDRRVFWIIAGVAGLVGLTYGVRQLMKDPDVRKRLGLDEPSRTDRLIDESSEESFQQAMRPVLRPQRRWAL